MVRSRLCAALVVEALLVAPRGARAGGATSADKDAARAERWEKKSEAVKPDRTAGDDQDDGEHLHEHLQKKSKASGKKADPPAGDASGETSDE